MPFITQERRNIIDAGDDPENIELGDICYMYYKPLVDRWRESPRWATAHWLYKNIVLSPPLNLEHQAARDLAWQVFFQLYVMPYELKKREENGDI